MFDRITRFFVRAFERWMPDPFVLVLVLTLVVFAAGIAVERATPLEMLVHWGDGFWSLLGFSMQMVMILLTGWVLATTPMVRAGLASAARRVSTPAGAIVAVTLVSLAASLVNWGFGLVVGAMYARELARAVRGVDYRLLVASAYSGFIVWHGGLSGSVPLTIATEGHFMAGAMGVVPTSATLFSAYNLAIVATLCVLVPLVNRMMVPREGDAVVVDPAKLDPVRAADAEADTGVARTPAQRLERSRALAGLVALAGLAYVAWYFAGKGGGLQLDIVNFAFLMLGLALHGRPAHFLAAVDDAARGAVQIAVQFPFYAGIMGMMLGSGLAATLSSAFVSIADARSMPFWTFLSAGFVNLFIPSGGGQWAVQAPVVIPAAQALGADLARTAMAVAWGDAWTNMIQPFWALPALAIAGLRARDVMGYCVIVMFASGAVIAGLLTFVP